MKLFTKEIDKKLFEQYAKGNDLENQMVVAKIFNPYGRGTWYLLNSDPEDPDYVWAIVNLFDVETGSISRNELESIKVPPFRLGLERDLSWTPKPAIEVLKGLQDGKYFAEGGGVEKNSNYKKFGKDNLRLVNFDIDDLDSYELMLYDQYTNSMDKADALQMLINTVESDYSQLNEQLAEIAEEQYPSDEFFEDNRQYKNGGGVDDKFTKGDKVTDGRGNVGIIKEVQVNGSLYIQWISYSGEPTSDLTADNNPENIEKMANGGGVGGLKVGQTVYHAHNGTPPKIFEGKITNINGGSISYTYTKYGQDIEETLVGGKNIEYFGVFTTKQQAKDYLLKEIDEKRNQILQLKKGGGVHTMPNGEVMLNSAHYDNGGKLTRWKHKSKK